MGNKRNKSAAAAAAKGSKHKNQVLPAKEDTSVIHLDDVEDSDWKMMHSAKAIVIVKEAAVAVKEVTNGSAQSGDEKMDTEAEAESPVVADAEDAKTSEGQHLVDISEAKTNGYDQLERELDLNGDSNDDSLDSFDSQELESDDTEEQSVEESDRSVDRSVSEDDKEEDTENPLTLEPSPFICEICGAGFKIKGYFTRHMANNHGLGNRKKPVTGATKNPCKNRKSTISRTAAKPTVDALGGRERPSSVSKAHTRKSRRFVDRDDSGGNSGSDSSASEAESTNSDSSLVNSDDMQEESDYEGGSNSEDGDDSDEEEGEEQNDESNAAVDSSDDDSQPKRKRRKYGSGLSQSSGPRKTAITKENYAKAIEAGLSNTVQYRGLMKPFITTAVSTILRIMAVEKCSFGQAKAKRMALQKSKAAMEDEDNVEVYIPKVVDDDEFDQVQQPETMSIGCIMRPYQVSGLSWLIQQHARRMNSILADEMGLGKTLQTISFVAHTLHVKKEKGQFLIIVPKSVLPNWIAEFRKWCPSISTIKLHSQDAREQKRLKEKMKFCDVVVTTYDTVKMGAMKNCFNRIIWNSIVLDEGHRLKNEKSHLSRACANLRACFKLILTGTPVQNNLHESWALLHFLRPEVFTESQVFDEAFDLSTRTAASKAKASAVAALEDSEDEDAKVNKKDDQANGGIDRNIIAKSHYLIRPFILRRLKSEVEKSLPPKLETLIKCPMTSMQKLWTKGLLYKDRHALETRYASSSRAMQDMSKTAVQATKKLQMLLMQLRKAANHPYLFPGCETISMDGLPTEEIVKYSGKMVVLDKLLKKLIAKGHRIVLFSQFKQILDVIEDFLSMRGGPYARISRIDGSTNGVMRSVLINEFNAPDSKKKLFLLTTRAGGEGVNLYTADTVILFDSDWNPQVDNQAMARVHRIGQRKVVHVYRLISAGTVEERIVQRAQKKLFLDGMVNRGSSAIAKEMDAALQADDEADLKDEADVADVVSALKFGWNSIFSSGNSVNAEVTDEEIDSIIDRKRGLDRHGKLLTDATSTSSDKKNFNAESESEAALNADNDGKDKDASAGNFEEDVEVRVADFDESIPLVSIREFEGEIVEKVMPAIDMYEKKMERRHGVSSKHILTGKRSRESRYVEEEVEGVGTVQILKSNMYSLEDGEPSILARKGGKGGGQDMEQIYKTRVMQQAGRDYSNQDHCQICWNTETESELLCCDFCPMSYHLKCVRLKTVPEGRYTCHHHRCAKCDRTSAQAEFLFRCEQCYITWCMDCKPNEGVVLTGHSDRLEKLGYRAPGNAYYMLCSEECQNHYKEAPESGSDEEKDIPEKKKKLTDGKSAPKGLKRSEYEEFHHLMDAVNAFELHDFDSRLSHLKSVDLQLTARFPSLDSIHGFRGNLETTSPGLRIILRNIVQQILYIFGKEFIPSDAELIKGANGDQNDANADANPDAIEKMEVEETEIEKTIRSKRAENKREHLRAEAADKALLNYSGVPLDGNIEPALPGLEHNRFEILCIKAVVVTVRLLTSISAPNLISLANLIGIVKHKLIFGKGHFRSSLSENQVQRRKNLPEPAFVRVIKGGGKRRILEEAIAVYMVTLLPQNAMYSENPLVPPIEITAGMSEKQADNMERIQGEIIQVLNAARLLESNMFLLQDSNEQWFTGQTLEKESCGKELIDKGWSPSYAPCNEQTFDKVMAPVYKLYNAVGKRHDLRQWLRYFPTTLANILYHGHNRLLNPPTYQEAQEQPELHMQQIIEKEKANHDKMMELEREQRILVRDKQLQERQQQRLLFQQQQQQQQLLQQQQRQLQQQQQLEERQRVAQMVQKQKQEMQQQKQALRQQQLLQQRYLMINANPIMLTPLVDVINFCGHTTYERENYSWEELDATTRMNWTRKFIDFWKGSRIEDQLVLEKQCREFWKDGKLKDAKEVKEVKEVKQRRLANLKRDQSMQSQILKDQHDNIFNSAHQKMVARHKGTMQSMSSQFKSQLQANDHSADYQVQNTPEVDREKIKHHHTLVRTESIIKMNQKLKDLNATHQDAQSKMKQKFALKYGAEIEVMERIHSKQLFELTQSSVDTKKDVSFPSEAVVNDAFDNFHNTYKSNNEDKKAILGSYFDVTMEAGSSKSWRQISDVQKLQLIRSIAQKDHNKNVLDSGNNSIAVPECTHVKYIRFCPSMNDKDHPVPWSQADIDDTFKASIQLDDPDWITKSVADWKVLTLREQAKNIMHYMRTRDGRVPSSDDSHSIVYKNPAIPAFTQVIAQVVLEEKGAGHATAPVSQPQATVTNSSAPAAGVCPILLENIEATRLNNARKLMLNSLLPSVFHLAFAASYTDETSCSAASLSLTEKSHKIVFAQRVRDEYATKNQKKMFLLYLEKELFLRAPSFASYCDANSLKHRVASSQLSQSLSLVPNNVPLEAARPAVVPKLAEAPPRKIGDSKSNAVKPNTFVDLTLTDSQSTVSDSSVVDNKASVSEPERQKKYVHVPKVIIATPKQKYVSQAQVAREKVCGSDARAEIDARAQAKPKPKNNDDIEETACAICNNGDADDDNDILLCDGCDKGYHQNCHVPAITMIPEDDFFCASCSNKMEKNIPRL